MEENTSLLGEIKSEQYKNKVKLTFVWLWRFCIFAVTGSSSVHVTRMLLHWLHCQDNAWYYYVAFFFAELLVYTGMIVFIGSILFQWRFFCRVAYKMWSWLLPKKGKNWCAQCLYDDPSTVLV